MTPAAAGKDGFPGRKQAVPPGNEERHADFCIVPEVGCFDVAGVPMNIGFGMELEPSLSESWADREA